LTAAVTAFVWLGCEWQDGFTFSDFVRTRPYDSKDTKRFILPGVLRYFDVDEFRVKEPDRMS